MKKDLMLIVVIAVVIALFATDYLYSLLVLHANIDKFREIVEQSLGVIIGYHITMQSNK